MVTHRTFRNDETLDPYDLVEALTGRKLARPSSSLPSRSRPTSEGYVDLSDIRACAQAKQEGPEPDPQPEDISVGCINPFALAENMVGHKIDRHSITAIHVLQDTLQTDYEELFDMKHHSVLYAGLKLNEKERRAERLEEGEMKILNEKDLVTPDLSRLDKLGDLEEVGMKEIGNLRIKRAGIMNNKIHLILHANDIARTVCNREVTRTLNDFCLPFRREEREKESFTPPNSSWRDARDVLIMRNMRRNMISEYMAPFDFRVGRHELHGMRKFDDPIQGAMGNSWFVAALFSVFWADPAMINRNTNLHHHMMRVDFEDHENRFRVKFHDKGGRNNSKTEVSILSVYPSSQQLLTLAF
ncbi:hypothetical protein RRF57_010423 [Xylaria bambusicola]|uniref:Uncharacterized protein n=1 Tax=Xylaria bambusicola TaxID=326684 RepID=A0AAN7UL86_9PEZI